MSVWCLFVCGCDEYGCMDLQGIYQTEAQAHAVAKANGWQNEQPSDAPWCHRFDYYMVQEWRVE